MKIAFFGYYGSFDYGKIGGTNSLVRRISTEMVKTYKIEVDHVIYGKFDKINEHSCGIVSRYYKTIEDAFDKLKDYNHVITIYIHPRDALRYMFFRNKYKKEVHFHIIYINWPQSFFKRQMEFAVNRLVSNNGMSFAISPRTFNLSKKWGYKSQLLLPPVPKDYYLDIKTKKTSEKIKLTFIGRVDVGKGVLETIDIFNQLSKDDTVDLNFYGIYWKNDPIATKIHQNLLKQKNFRYFPLNFEKYSPEADETVRKALNETDIFIQPYRSLSSSIDMPLLILEAMASLCAVITKPYGDIPKIYGQSKCLINDNIISESLKLISSAEEWLDDERNRLYLQNKELFFDTPSITRTFLKSLRDAEEGINGF